MAPATPTTSVASAPAPAAPVGMGRKRWNDAEMRRNAGVAAALNDEGALSRIYGEAHAQAEFLQKKGLSGTAAADIAEFARKKMEVIKAGRGQREEADRMRVEMASSVGLAPEDLGYDSMSDDEIRAEYKQGMEEKAARDHIETFTKEQQIRAANARPPVDRSMTDEQRAAMIEKMKKRGIYEDGDEALSDRVLEKEFQTRERYERNEDKWELEDFDKAIDRQQKIIDGARQDFLAGLATEEDAREAQANARAQIKRLIDKRSNKAAGRSTVSPAAGSLLDKISRFREGK